MCTTDPIRSRFDESACALCRRADAIYIGGPAWLGGEAGICADCADQWGVESCRLMHGAIAPARHVEILAERDQAEERAWADEVARRERLPPCIECHRRARMCRTHLEMAVAS